MSYPINSTVYDISCFEIEIDNILYTVNATAEVDQYDESYDHHFGTRELTSNQVQCIDYHRILVFNYEDETEKEMHLAFVRPKHADIIRETIEEHVETYVEFD